MKVFVTGATGYIGSHLVKALANKGYEVHAYCRSARKGSFISFPGVQIFTGTLLEKGKLEEAMRGCQQVYHLAAFAKVWAKDSGHFYEVNVLGTKNLLEVAQSLEVEKVVFTSTGGVFGASMDGEVTEDFVRKKDFFNEYEGSKCLAESWVKDFVIQGMNIVIVNPTRVYGPYLFGQPESVTKMIASFVRGNWRWIPGSPENSGNYVFIDDVVRGHLMAMEKGIRGRSYILGGLNYSYQEFFGVLKKQSGIQRKLYQLPIWMIMLIAKISLFLANTFGLEPQLTPKWVAKAKYHWNVDASRSFNELGIEPTPLDIGLKATVEWLKS